MHRLPTAVRTAAYLVLALGVWAQAGPPDRGDRQPTKEQGPPRVDRHGDPLPPGAVARLGTVRWELAGRLAYSPDGNTLAAIGGDRAVLLDAREGKQRRECKRLDCGVLAVASPPDGRILALELGPDRGRDDKREPVYFREVVTGRELRRFDCPRDLVWSGALTPDGKTAALGGSDIRLWDTTAGREVGKLAGHQEGTSSLAFSPDGKWLASGEGYPLNTGEPKPAEVKVWDVATGRPVRCLTGHRGVVYGVAFSPDGKRLATGGTDRSVRLWDLAAGKTLWRLQMPSDNVDVGVLAFSPDGKVLALGAGAKITLVDAASGTELPQAQGHRTWVSSLAFSPDGRTVASAGGDGTVRLWDWRTGRQLHQLIVGRHGGHSGVAVSPGGKMVASGDDEGRVSVWETATAKRVRQFEPTGEARGEPWSVAFAGDGVLAAANLGTVYLWAVDTGERLHRFALEDDSVDSLATSPDGRTLAAGGYDGKVHLWDVQTGRRQRRLRGGEEEQGSVCALAYSADGKVLASALESQVIRLWEVDTGGELATLRLPRKENRANTFRSIALALALSPDGRVVASGTDDPSPRLWDTVTGKQLCRLEGHREEFMSLAFSPDGQALASGSRDTTILIWDTKDVVGRARRPAELAPRELEGLWQALAGKDADRAYRAIWALAGDARQSVPFLERRLRPAPGVKPQRLTQLLEDLDDKDFAVRERAEQELGSLEELAVPALRRALEGPPSPEFRRRAERLLDQAEEKRLAPSPEQARALRALRVLERAATPEAQSLLAVLSRGAPESRLTQEARAARERLARRNPPSP